jgi:hypothetical protein
VRRALARSVSIANDGGWLPSAGLKMPAIPVIGETLPSLAARERLTSDFVSPVRGESSHAKTAPGSGLPRNNRKRADHPLVATVGRAVGRSDLRLVCLLGTAFHLQLEGL